MVRKTEEGERQEALYSSLKAAGKDHKAALELAARVRVLEHLA